MVLWHVWQTPFHIQTYIIDNNWVWSPCARAAYSSVLHFSLWNIFVLFIIWHSELQLHMKITFWPLDLWLYVKYTNFLLILQVSLGIIPNLRACATGRNSSSHSMRWHRQRCIHRAAGLTIITNKSHIRTSSRAWCEDSVLKWDKTD